MKSVTGYLFVALLLAAIGAGALRNGLLDRDIADAQARVAAGDYDQQEILDTAERYYEYASRVPGVGSGPVDEIRARKAGLLYWQHRYGELSSTAPDPLADIPPENPALQFVVANAAYRDRIGHAKDKTSTLAALDASIAVYLTVLRNAKRHDAAAYNYEYLVRVRDDLVKGKRRIVPADVEEPHGLGGKQEEQTNAASFKVYVPLESHEREINDNDIGAAKAGKSAPIKRKG